MLLYKLPKEIDFGLVVKDFTRYYPNADAMGKIQLSYWRHVSECLHDAGYLCPTFRSFLTLVTQTDLISAISCMLIATGDIGTKKETIQVVQDYYTRRTVNNVIYVDFNE